MRALMGANMQRQAVPVLRPESPIVGTGMEAKIAYDCGAMVIAKHDGEVTFVSSDTIKVLTKSFLTDLPKSAGIAVPISE